MRTLALALILVLGCTTATQPTQSQQAAAPQAQSQTQSQSQGMYKNLQVLPKDIQREQLLTVMRGFTRGLGVRCNFCHVVTATEPKEVLEFPNDAKEEKRVARVMMQMVSQINGTWLPRVEAAEGEHVTAEQIETRVSCWTCHRGKTEPDTAPPPPPPSS
jgi:hypothetical protein